jgi:hypothetical protein
MGGNCQLLRVYVDENIAMAFTGIGMCFRGHMCHQPLSIYIRKHWNELFGVRMTPLASEYVCSWHMGHIILLHTEIMTVLSHEHISSASIGEKSESEHIVPWQ